jgi:predicted nucleic acid-binding protein
MTLVIDASVVVGALIDDGQDGAWAEQLLASGDLAAPHLMPAEATNILRIAAIRGDISRDSASLAHADLLALPVELFSYEPFAFRVWELRNSVTTYDAWYVALAESIAAPLATLDLRLARAPGPRCDFMTPPSMSDR